MTDTELNELEAMAKFLIDICPVIILGLIAGLRQTRAERDWLAAFDPTPPEPEFKFGDKVEIKNGDEWIKGIYLGKELKTNDDHALVRFEKDGQAQVLCRRNTDGMRHADW